MVDGFGIFSGFVIANNGMSVDLFIFDDGCLQAGLRQGCAV